MWHKITEEEAKKVEGAFKTELYRRCAGFVIGLVAAAVLIIGRLLIDYVLDTRKLEVLVPKLIIPAVVLGYSLWLLIRYCSALINFKKRKVQCIEVRVGNKWISKRFKIFKLFWITVTSMHGSKNTFVQDLNVSRATYDYLQKDETAMVIYFGSAEASLGEADEGDIEGRPGDSTTTNKFKRRNAYLVPYIIRK